MRGPQASWPGSDLQEALGMRHLQTSEPHAGFLEEEWGGHTVVWPCARQGKVLNQRIINDRGLSSCPWNGSLLPLRRAEGSRLQPQARAGQRGRQECSAPHLPDPPTQGSYPPTLAGPQAPSLSSPGVGKLS